MDKLTLEEVEQVASADHDKLYSCQPHGTANMLRILSKQLANTMRREALLREAYGFGVRALENVGYKNLAEIMEGIVNPNKQPSEDRP
jgi:hypothetical protein